MRHRPVCVNTTKKGAALVNITKKAHKHNSQTYVYSVNTITTAAATIMKGKQRDREF